MEFTPTNFAFCLFASIVGFSLMQQMPSAAAFSCGPGEIQSETKSPTPYTLYCVGCQDTCANYCQPKGRKVTKIECNFWGVDPAVCRCCCGLPFSGPPILPPSIAFSDCPTNEILKYFQPPKDSEIDCNLCVNGCKNECDSIGAQVTKELCVYSSSITSNVLCPCCCNRNSPPPSSPPPPPPPPSPPPPPTPSISPPPPSASTPPPPSSSPPWPPEACCSKEIEVSTPGQEPCRYGLLPRRPPLPSLPGSFLFAAI
ncbi:wiskott-Aldrich syndrome protein homolog 1-like isoform X2 [Papaver somniferum]|uniref:wiskott-Aldrich syndrome protein homolog 1-like isoform X2 n=1 Tax=Papaver somniferum TaxID=3469 RepID=UPI000E700B3B|nr:wiskott-Aldrich syndrome protein homolog 1-like isoform X2 [Papaver somniferum]